MKIKFFVFVVTLCLPLNGISQTVRETDLSESNVDAQSLADTIWLSDGYYSDEFNFLADGRFLKVSSFSDDAYKGPNAKVYESEGRWAQDGSKVLLIYGSDGMNVGIIEGDTITIDGWADTLATTFVLRRQPGQGLGPVWHAHERRMKNRIWESREERPESGIIESKAREEIPESGIIESRAQITDGSYALSDGQVQFEIAFAGEIIVVDKNSARFATLKSGMTREEVVETLRAAGLTYDAAAKDRWIVGGTTIIFERDRLVRYRNY